MKIGFRNSYANVVATAALVVALGGTGYASVASHHRAGSGSLPATLAHGKTLRGAWGLSAMASSTADDETDSISYPIHLAKNVTVVVRPVGAGSSHNCPGTVTAPQARAGFLCVYVGAGENHDAISHYSPIDGNDTNYKYGAVIIWVPIAPGFTFASGTWAVTAK
jgi:hypothetical protein